MTIPSTLDILFVSFSIISWDSLMVFDKASIFFVESIISLFSVLIFLLIYSNPSATVFILFLNSSKSFILSIISWFSFFWSSLYFFLEVAFYFSLSYKFQDIYLYFTHFNFFKPYLSLLNIIYNLIFQFNFNIAVSIILSNLFSYILHTNLSLILAWKW